MGKVIAAITTSVDAYIVGPKDGPEHGLGIGGERLHYWVMGGPWTYADDGHDTDGMHRADRELLRVDHRRVRLRDRRPQHVRRRRRLGRHQPIPRHVDCADPPHRGPARSECGLPVR
jgi:hypothetical protein